MATTLVAGDIAIVQYDSSTTDSFTFVFTRDVEAGTSVNFTDNGWLAAGGFRAGEGTVTYTAATAITAGTTVTLTGLNLDDAGDQIIAYQGALATPTILHVVDFADGNNTVAGDATNDNTTALPPGFTLGLNAVAVGFDTAIYAGPIDGSPPSCSPSSATRPTGSIATHCPRRPVVPLFLPAAPRSRFQQFDVWGRRLSGRGHQRQYPGQHLRYRQRHRRFRRPLYHLRADQHQEPVPR